MSKFELTQEQKLVVDTWGKGIAVLAGAGSGKTFTLTQKVRALLEKNPEARFAAVSFTEKSASDLRTKLTSLTLEMLKKPLMGHWVTTIHGLCSTIIREYAREAGFDGDEEILGESEAASVWERALDAFWFEELPEDISGALDRMMEREGRESLVNLLSRVRNLVGMGVLDRLADSPDLKILSVFALDRYDRLKRRLGRLDYNDLEHGADRALDVDYVRKDYQNRFDLVMVDEFQDTNPVQARILDRFVKPGFSNLCVVGDPKQSIYRFRDADVSVFQDFCSKLPVTATLSKNYRSVPGVIEFCNEVCEPAFQASGMEYLALHPSKEPDPQMEPVLSVTVHGPADLVRFIRSELDRGVKLSDMALLMRKIRGNPERWLKALIQGGIPIAIESGGLLWSDPRARELCALLKAWANPGNELSLVAALRAPWIGVSDLEIDAWKKAGLDPWFQFLELDRELSRALKGLYTQMGRVRPGEVLLELLRISEIEIEMGSTILALWHRCEELSERGFDFQRVAQEIGQACDENRREKGVPPPRSEGQLRVLTIHGSKGLEFPHVIILDFPELSQRAPNMPNLYWDRERGAFLSDKDSEGERIKDSEREAPWKILESEKELAETKRVLYVALTRAENRVICILETSTDPLKLEKVQKHREKYADIYKRDYWRAWIEKPLLQQKKWNSDRAISQKPIDLPIESASPRTGKPDLTFIPRRPRHSVSEWNLLTRCARSYEWSVARPQNTDDLKPDYIPRENDDAGEFSEGPAIPQNEIGTRVHRFLELGDEIGLKEMEKLLGKKRFDSGKVIDWMKSSKLMQDTDIQVWKELAFEIPVEDEALVGAMDRLVFSSKDGYSVVDFKVTSKLKSEAELLDAYGGQLNLYAWALEVLVPESRGRVSAYLVNLSGSGIREVRVELKPSELSVMKVRASDILRGESGPPTPGSLCAVCDHRRRCIEGRKFLTSKT